MAIYRNIQLSFWTDNKVEDDFTPEDKYFYLYLLTNPQTNICGCYEVSYTQMSNQTGYNKDTINRLLDRFEKFHNIIRYSRDTKEILILNWYKYNWSKSEKTLVGVENVAKYIKSSSFKTYVLNIVNSIRNDIPMTICPIQASVTDTDSVSITDKKRTTYKDILNDLLLEFNISNYLVEAVNDWIGYKKERNFTYKERGLRALLKTILDKSRQFGDEAVANAIRESISSGYQGIVWDKIGRNNNRNRDLDILSEWRNS